jgi:hypothetical protein
LWLNCVKKLRLTISSSGFAEARHDAAHEMRERAVISDHRVGQRRAA